MKLEEMEWKMSIEIGAVKAMMLHRLSEVDQKLIAIEHLLKKVIETRNDIGMPPETGDSEHGNVTKKDIGQGEVEFSKKGKKVVIREGDDGMLPGAEKSMQAPDGGAQETNDGILGPKGGILWGDWVSRDCKNDGWQGPPWELRGGEERRWPKYGPDFGIERDSCMPDWVCNRREHGFGKENGPCAGFDYGSHEGFGLKKAVKADETGLGGKKSETEPGIVKAGQDEIAKDSFKTDGLGTQGLLGKVGDDTEAQVGNEITAKSGVVESDNKTQAQAATEKSKKRKHHNQRVGGPNDVSTPVTATGERLDLFTSDEQEILNDIEPIMHSIHKIMHQNGYNAGDPLSADDQTYILDNVFNHHPERAQKMGDGVDYIMVMRSQESPCFYIVLNGRKEEFSYRECLANFIRGKYPDKVDRFMSKYFKEPKPYPPRKRDRGSDPDEVGTPSLMGFAEFAPCGSPFLALNLRTNPEWNCYRTPNGFDQTNSKIALRPANCVTMVGTRRSQSRLKHGSNVEVKTLLFPSGFNHKLNVATGKSGTPCLQSGLNTDASVATVPMPVFGWNKEGVVPTSGWNVTGFGIYNRPFEGFGPKVAKADETGLSGKKSENDSESIKAGEDEVSKISSKSDGRGTKGSSGSKFLQSLTGGGQTDVTSSNGLWACWGKKKDDKNVLPKDLSEVYQWGKIDSGLWGKATQKADSALGWNSVGKPQADVATDSWRTELAARLDSVPFDKGSKQPKALVAAKGSNRKGHEESEKQGSFGQKNQQGCGPKRKRPNLPVGGLNDDDSRSSGQMIVQVQLDNDPPLNEIATKPGSVESDKGDYKHLAQVSTEGSNEKGHEESEKLGSGVRKNQEGSPKRKCTDWPDSRPNDCPRSSGLFTVTGKRFHMFTSDELQILTDIEPIMQSIQRIMYQNGYNDGDPLSADDQTYILDNVFNHHPEKARKLGAGVDYIMVTKDIKFQEDRCFYVVLDGCKEELSYRECLENFVRGKYPDKVDEFIPKYFKEPRPSPTGNRDRGSCLEEVAAPLFRSGWGLEFSNFPEEIFKSVSSIQ